MSTTGLIDTHCHLMDRAFDDDRPSVVERARTAGVTSLLLVGYDLVTSRAAVDLTREIDGTWAAVGIHPNSAAAADADDFRQIAQMAEDEKVVAIGETGLDNYRTFTPRGRQREAFDWHLRLAADLDKPVVIHNRNADADILCATRHTQARGVLHCFSSEDVVYLDAMLAAGFFVSFAGTLTFKNAGRLRDMAQRVPVERLLVETDCPYLAPSPHRGRRNEPAFVRDTAACLASVVGLALDELTPVLRDNSVRAFGVPS